MTKKLTDAEKFNRRILRFIEATKGCGHPCPECILNNYGPSRKTLKLKYNSFCGAVAIIETAENYIDNFKMNGEPSE